MRREFHVRFCEGGGVRFPSATRLVLGFQYESDARKFRTELDGRLSTFGLELHPDKTRLLRFGRFATRDAALAGERGPGTLEFLGSTHIARRQRTAGSGSSGERARHECGRL